MVHSVDPLAPKGKNPETHVNRLMWFRIPLSLSLAVLTVVVVRTSLARSDIKRSETTVRVATSQRDATELRVETLIASASTTEVDESPCEDTPSTAKNGLQLVNELSSIETSSVSEHSTQPNRTDGFSVTTSINETNEVPEDPVDKRTILANPSDSGGDVHFLVDGKAYSLRAGESCELDPKSSYRIQFHRGDDFGAAEYVLDEGTFEFQVTPNGWDLRPNENENHVSPADK